MSEDNKTLPEVGFDSAAGPRWFVSCRYPNLTVTIRPAEDKTPTTRAIKGIYATFRSMAKPNSLQGQGKREKGRDDGQQDMNDSGKWGIFGPIVEPGPEPEGGYQNDTPQVPRERRLTAAKKSENRMIIDRLRETIHYRHTRQTNEIDIHTHLGEITWDPTPFSGNIVGAVTRGRPSIGKDGVNDNAAPGVGAPAETRAAAPAVKVPTLGRPVAAAK